MKLKVGMLVSIKSDYPDSLYYGQIARLIEVNASNCRMELVNPKFKNYGSFNLFSHKLTPYIPFDLKRYIDETKV